MTRLPRKNAPPLRRGTACLACRKRKSRCDGTHPVCQQCIKANREDECQYAGLKRKKHSRQNVSVLGRHLFELETTSAFPSKIFPLKPQVTTSTLESIFTTPSASSSSSSLSESPSSSTLEFLSYDETNTAALDILDSTSTWTVLYLGDSTYSGVTYPNNGDSLPPKVKTILIEAFLSHQHQCYFEGCGIGITESERHPAFMNAVYFLGCYYTRSPHLANLETHFLNLALHGIASALAGHDRTVDVVRASSLLALYFYSTGQIAEGYRHSVSAARLALSIGLHRICLPDLSGRLPDSITHTGMDINDRVSTFWQIFMVDTCWSAATGFPSLLSRSSDYKVRIETPLPTNQSSADTNSLFGEIMALPSIPALKVKVAALYEEAARISSDNNIYDTEYWYNFTSVKNALERIQVFLPLVRDCSPHIPKSVMDVDIFFIRTLVYVSMININRIHNPTDALQASLDATSLISDLSDDAYEYLDPLFSVLWTSIAKAHTWNIHHGGSERYPILQTKLSLHVVVSALKSLGQYVPLAANCGAQIEEDCASSDVCDPTRLCDKLVWQPADSTPFE
ncbi:uncharacterized protein EV420DRAFT_387716 [Desarmillaria tabescens]|uniref:Zn(2)-C6 fungal-type domain-containing protein n=1 Tax=Armillaria tabescens TaxID=1929756 RepID=A0AA39KBS9_ARMTA|nr:uncharacterized protein EV420DRAFT_387716 [Desarmillaria tabescens]KAK0458257.1 hypothetical protein EV420DRAFT_387716 [Desarmillaria tabescens]